MALEQQQAAALPRDERTKTGRHVSRWSSGVSARLAVHPTTATSSDSACQRSNVDSSSTDATEPVASLPRRDVLEWSSGKASRVAPQTPADLAPQVRCGRPPRTMGVEDTAAGDWSGKRPARTVALRPRRASAVASRRARDTKKRSRVIDRGGATPGIGVTSRGGGRSTDEMYFRRLAQDARVPPF